MKLRKILTHIQISDRTFQTGDRFFRECTISLGEQDRSSSCTIALHDPKLRNSGRLFQQSFEQGGIIVPEDLLSAPPEKKSRGLGGIPQLFQKGSLEDFPGDSALILNEAATQGIIDIPSLAYILATVEREAGPSFKPIKEIGVSETQYESVLAPTGEGYVGRGYVQLTWLTNYEKYTKLTRKDLVADPALALEPDTAAFILVHGMLTGHFTGAGLRDFISEDGSQKDYVSARKIINGNDKAQLIAGLAREWEDRLTAIGVDAPDNDKPEETEPTDTDIELSDSAVKEIVEGVEEGVNAAIKKDLTKGTEIIVSLSEGNSAPVSFHFIHTATITGVRPNSLTLKGNTIRWLLSRRKLNATYQDITLRGLAEIVCKAHGLALGMEGDGPSYAHLDQSGLSDFGLLKRECEAIGFFLRDSGNVLEIKPMRPNFTGYVVQPKNIIGNSLSFTDQASADMPAMRSPGEVSKVKAEISPGRGTMEQVRQENSEGASSIEGGASRDLVTGDASAPVYGTIKVSDNDAGLPTQKAGAIALANGERIEAQALKQEVTRVEGYPGSVQLKTTAAELSLVPGQIIAFSPDCAGGVFAREARIKAVVHNIAAESRSITSIEFYTPQKAVPKKKEGDNSATTSSSSSSTQSVNESGWLRPSAGVLTSDGYWRNTGRPTHYGVDLAASGRSEIFCSYDGTVVDVEKGGAAGNPSLGGGFGNLVFVQSGEYEHRYCHLAPTGCPLSIGDEVKQGDLIGIEGDTGNSRGQHLHWECRQMAIL